MGIVRRALLGAAVPRLMAAALATVALLTAGGAATGAGLTDRAVDDAEECTEAVPAAHSIAGVQDDGRQLVVNVHLLLDGVPEARADAVMTKAQEAYAPHRITLRWTAQAVDFPAQRSETVSPLGGPKVPTSDSSYMFQKSKETVNGAPPDGTDIVYLMTTDNITGTVAGQADCIGGIRYPNRSFAIGEEEPDRQSSSVNLCCTWSSAKVAAHEIAHLLGAHHHYANCAEGTSTAVADRHLGTCTLMFNDTGLMNLTFSALEGAVVRGHVLRFVDQKPANPPPVGVTPPPSASPSPRPSSTPGPTPTPSPTPEPEPSASPEPTEPPPSSPPQATPEPTSSPEPEPEPVSYARSVTVDLVRHLVVKGRVDAGAATSCASSIAVVVERRRGVDWERIQEATTQSDGSFRVTIPDRKGTYRVVAPEITVHDDGESRTCTVASSSPARHSHR